MEKANGEIYSPAIGALTYFVVHQIVIIDRMPLRIIDTVKAYLHYACKVMDTCDIPYNVFYRIKIRSCLISILFKATRRRIGLHQKHI